MLYRYPAEQKKTAQETVKGNRRYDTYTGEELPPVPYAGSTAQSRVTNAAKSGGQNSTAGYAVQSATNKNVQTNQKKAEVENYYLNSRDRLKNYYKSQLDTEKMSNEDIMRQLYIAYMQGIKNMPQQSALWGAGGEIESLKSRHRINYEENRAKQNEKYSGIISEIQQKYNKDLMELEEKYLKQLMSL